jgi:hypothetical protein
MTYWAHPFAILQSSTILARLDAVGQIVGLAYMPDGVEKACEAQSYKSRANLNAYYERLAII